MIFLSLILKNNTLALFSLYGVLIGKRGSVVQSSSFRIIRASNIHLNPLANSRFYTQVFSLDI